MLFNVIGQFFGATIFLLSMSSAMTVIIMKLHFSGEHGHQVPPWLRRLVIVWLARIVRLDTAPQSKYPVSTKHIVVIVIFIVSSSVIIASVVIAICFYRREAQAATRGPDPAPERVMSGPCLYRFRL